MATKKQPTPATAQSPNLYELEGGGITVSYATSGIDGQARLHYKDAKLNVTAVGDQIQSYAGPGAGARVGMVLQTVPDSKTVSFVLVLPRVNMGPSNRARITTFSVTVTSKTTIGGPGLVPGQVDSYKLTELKGNAKFVLF